MNMGNLWGRNQLASKNVPVPDNHHAFAAPPAPAPLPSPKRQRKTPKSKGGCKNVRKAGETSTPIMAMEKENEPYNGPGPAHLNFGEPLSQEASNPGVNPKPKKSSVRGRPRKYPINGKGKVKLYVKTPLGEKRGRGRPRKIRFQTEAQHSIPDLCYSQSGSVSSSNASEFDGLQIDDILDLMEVVNQRVNGTKAQDIPMVQSIHTITTELLRNIEGEDVLQQVYALNNEWIQRSTR